METLVEGTSSVVIAASFSFASRLSFEATRHSLGWVHSAVAARAWWSRTRTRGRASTSSRVGGLIQETTLTIRRFDVSAHADITLLTPGGSPRVLDDPVVSSVTDSQDTMIQLFTASSGENTTLVMLETSLVSFNGNGNRSLSKSSLKLIWVLFRNISVGSDSGDNVSLLGSLAVFVLHEVRIVRL